MRASRQRQSADRSSRMRNMRGESGPSPGAPKGNRNALKRGRYTAEAIARRRGCFGPHVETALDRDTSVPIPTWTEKFGLSPFQQTNQSRSFKLIGAFFLVDFGDV